MPTVKACTKCGEVKPLDEFHKNKRNRDGRRSRCKECTAEYHRRYRCENREVLLERNRSYREENREYLNAKTSSYRAVAQGLSKALSSVPLYTPWSEEEDALLMADNGMKTYEKAIHLGRTYNSCVGRRHNIRKRRTTNV